MPAGWLGLVELLLTSNLHCQGDCAYGWEFQPYLGGIRTSTEYSVGLPGA